MKNVRKGKEKIVIRGGMEQEGKMVAQRSVRLQSGKEPETHKRDSDFCSRTPFPKNIGENKAVQKGTWTGGSGKGTDHGPSYNWTTCKGR